MKGQPVENPDPEIVAYARAFLDHLDRLRRKRAAGEPERAAAALALALDELARRQRRRRELRQAAIRLGLHPPPLSRAQREAAVAEGAARATKDMSEAARAA
jgi:hypothetical protein